MGTGDTTALAAAISAARARWPDVAVDTQAFRAHLVAQLPQDDPGRALSGWHVADLYLAFACGRGDR